ncbi:MAG: hypothetical protein AAF725_08920 [Acidobacteriota bacterium]
MSEKRHESAADQRFDAALTRWAERPPQTPPRQAGQKLLARLRERRRRAAFGRLAMASAAVLALVSVLWLGGGAGNYDGGARVQPALPAGQPSALTAENAGETSLGDGVVLIWLDRETPLYMNMKMNFGSPDGTPGGSS